VPNDFKANSRRPVAGAAAQKWPSNFIAWLLLAAQPELAAARGGWAAALVSPGKS